ncbi:MAG TPA: hypothetical protein VF161_07140 [Steroidobacteraceae bacterium]|jgi:hypothetical protein
MPGALIYDRVIAGGGRWVVRSSSLVLVTVTLAIAACASHKEPATEAVADMRTSLEALREDASLFAPEELARVDRSVQALDELLARGEYKAVVDRASKVEQQLSALEEKVSARRTESGVVLAAVNDEWRVLSIEVPRMLEAIEQRIMMLSVSMEGHQAVPASAIESARDSLNSMNRAYAEAMTLWSAGNQQDAIAKAQAVQEKGRQVYAELGMRASGARAIG